MCKLKLAGSCRFVREGSYGRRGLCLVRFMLNSVSISWLLPSLQQKAQRNTSPQKSSGFDRRSVQSFIPRPGATEHCQQTFHWNHIKPLLFPHFCALTLSVSLCPFMFHLFLTLCFLPQCVFFPLFSASPSGTSRCLSHAVLVFKPLCLPLSQVYQSTNSLTCPQFNLSTFQQIGHMVNRLLRLAPVMVRSLKMIHFSSRFVHLIFYFMCG